MDIWALAGTLVDSGALQNLAWPSPYSKASIPSFPPAGCLPPIPRMQACAADLWQETPVSLREGLIRDHLTSPMSMCLCSLTGTRPPTTHRRLLSGLGPQHPRPDQSRRGPEGRLRAAPVPATVCPRCGPLGGFMGSPREPGEGRSQKARDHDLGSPDGP